MFYLISYMPLVLSMQNKRMESIEFINKILPLSIENNYFLILIGLIFISTSLMRIFINMKINYLVEILRHKLSYFLFHGHLKQDSIFHRILITQN